MTRILSPELLKTPSVKVTLCEREDYNVEAEFKTPELMFLHLKWKTDPRITPSLYKGWLVLLGSIRKQARARGIDRINIFVPEALIKFESMLGFEIDAVYNSNRDTRFVTMSQPT